MPDRLNERKPKGTGSKIVTAAAVGLILGIGLCTAGASLPNENVSEGFLVAGSVSFWGSGLVLIGAFVFAMFIGIFRKDKQ